MTKTLEQLKEEARIAAETLAAAEKAEREAAEQARREKEEKERKARLAIEAEMRLAILNPVLKAATAMGMPPTSSWNDSLRFDAARSTVRVEDEVAKISSWRSKRTGRFVIVLESWDSDVRAAYYRPSKNGKLNGQPAEYNYDGLIAKLKERYEAEAAKQKCEATEAELAAAATERGSALAKKLGVSETLVAGVNVSSYYGGDRRYHTSRHIADEGKVFVNVGRLELTIEKAEALVKVLRELGIK